MTEPLLDRPGPPSGLHEGAEGSYRRRRPAIALREPEGLTAGGFGPLGLAGVDRRHARLGEHAAPEPEVVVGQRPQSPVAQSDDGRGRLGIADALDDERGGGDKVAVAGRLGHAGDLLARRQRLGDLAGGVEGLGAAQAPSTPVLRRVVGCRRDLQGHPVPAGGLLVRVAA